MKTRRFDYTEFMALDEITISLLAWTSAADSENFDAIKQDSACLEESWGLVQIGSDENYEFLRFLVTDKAKWFLAKIKHGF